MESKAESDYAIKLHVQILTNKLVLSMLLGIGGIIFSALMFQTNSSIIFVGFFFTSILFLWFYIPALELYVIAYIIRKWKAVTSYADKDDERRINKIAGKLLTAAYISALISIIPYILSGILGSGSILRALWTSVIALISSVLGIMSFKLYNKISGQVLERIASVFSVVVCLTAITVAIFLSTSKKSVSVPGNPKIPHNISTTPNYSSE